MARVSIEDRTLQAIAKLQDVTDKSIGEFTEDSAKLAAQLLRDSTLLSEGKLANSVHVEKKKPKLHAIETDAKNDKGHGYGAAQEYGYHTKAGNKIKGKFFIIRGTTGMIAKWQRGEKWRD